MVVMSALVMGGMTALSIWTTEQVAIKAAEGANVIMEASRKAYLASDAESREWPYYFRSDGEKAIHDEQLVRERYVSESFDFTPYDAVLVNDEKILEVRFEAYDELSARIAAMHINGIARVDGKQVIASTGRPVAHGNHEDILDLAASRPITGDMDLGGHGMKGLKWFFRADKADKRQGRPAGNDVDWAYFPDDPDIAIAFAGDEINIIGRYPTPDGYIYGVRNSSPDDTRNHVIPLRTEAEWLSFKNIAAPRDTHILICEISDTELRSCDASITRTLTLTASPVSVRVGSKSTFTWTSTGYIDCMLKHLKDDWIEGLEPNGDHLYRIKKGGRHVIDCAADDGSGRKQKAITVRIKKPLETCKPKWRPSTSTVCEGTYLRQEDGCGESRTLEGTKNCTAPPDETDPCDEPDVTVHHSFVKVKYSQVFKRSADTGGLCTWSKYRRDHPSQNDNGFVNKFLFGARTTSGDGCPGYGFAKGDCHEGAEYMKDNPSKYDPILYTCRECLDGLD